MTVSQKQLEANRKNAQKGGVKTPEGKAIVKYNALKHGLLAQEAVVTVGDGAENPQEFEGLWSSLKAQLAPEGALEEMLVEKVAVAYWRMRRAHRYEVGLIRNDLDNAVEDFYNETRWDHQKQNKTDAEIDNQIAAGKRELAAWRGKGKRIWSVCSRRVNPWGIPMTRRMSGTGCRKRSGTICRVRKTGYGNRPN